MLRIARYVCLNAGITAAALAASVGGVIYDPAGAVVPKAAVTLVNDQNGSNQIVETNEAGRFNFPALNPGRYHLEVRGPGFAVFHRYGLALDAASAVSLPVFLRLGTVTESLEITSPAPAGAPRAPAPAAALRATGQLQQPRVIRMTRLPYPEAAKARGAQGPVVVRGVILEDGTLADLAAGADADPALAEAAIAAIRGWRYQPALLDGKPVASETVISLQFKLQ